MRSFHESVFLFTIQCSSPSEPSVPTRCFYESILFVRLEALRGSEQRVVRIVGMVGLTLDETPPVTPFSTHHISKKPNYEHPPD